MIRFVRILPVGDPEVPGGRLRLDYDPDNTGAVVLADEDVPPEQLANPDARHAVSVGNIDLTGDRIAWLHDQLGELRAALAAEAPTITAIPVPVDVTDAALRANATAGDLGAALELARLIPLRHDSDPAAVLLAAAFVRLHDKIERWRWTEREREQLSRFVERHGELYTYTCAAIVRELDEQDGDK